MNCPNCRHDNASDARFCAQCATPLTQPAAVAPTTPTAAVPAAPAGRRNTRPIVLAVLFLLLLLALGTYAVLQRVAKNKVATPPPAGTQATGRADDSKAKGAGPQPGARSAGVAIGATSAPGTGAAGGAAAGRAPDDATPSGPPIERHAQASGDATGAPDTAGTAQAADSMAGLLGALSSAVGGAHRHDPVDFHTLEALLPSSLPDMQPATPAGSADETMSIKTTSAHVDFTGPNDARVSLSIKDATAISGLAGLATMATADSSEQGDSYEKTKAIDGRSVHEKWDAAARHGELSLSVGQRFAVDVTGDHVDMGALENALAHVDLAKLESLKDANPVAK